MFSSFKSLEPSPSTPARISSKSLLSPSISSRTVSCWTLSSSISLKSLSSFLLSSSRLNPTSCNSLSFSFIPLSVSSAFCLTVFKTVSSFKRPVLTSSRLLSFCDIAVESSSSFILNSSSLFSPSDFLSFSVLCSSDDKNNSNPFSSSLMALYRSAFFAWRFMEFICLFTSPIISLTLMRFCFVASILLSAASLRCLYLFMPAASSKSARLSSGFAFTSQPTCPCSMIEYALVPIPVSVNRSTISLSLHCTLFI